MNRLWLGTALVLVMSAICVKADSIVTVSVTSATFFVSPNYGTSDNVGVAIIGPGTNFSLSGGILCLGWCGTFDTFSPGQSPSLDFGSISLQDLFGSLLIGGQTYDANDIYNLQSPSAAVLGTFTFPANPGGSTFTNCVPATSGPFSLYGANSAGAFQINLQMPTKGTFCSIWDFDSEGRIYQFASGKVVLTTVPEPGSMVLAATGLMAMVEAKRRRTVVKHS